MINVSLRVENDSVTPWRFLPNWSLFRSRRRLDPRYLSEHLQHDIGLTDVRAEQPKGIRD